MKWYTRSAIVVLIVSIAVVVNANTVGSPITALAQFRKKHITNKDLPELIKILAEKEKVDYDKLIKLATCESTMRHYVKDNEVLRGYVNKNDGGVFQINKPTWQKTADKLNLNLDDPVDNCLMAIWIIKNDSRSWNNWVCYKNIKH